MQASSAGELPSLSEPVNNNSEWIASREYVLHYSDSRVPSNIVAYLGRPGMDSSPGGVPGTWRCRLLLRDTGRDDRSYDAMGIDAIQSMRVAMHILRAWIESMPSEREGATHIEWAGGPGSGLPSLE